MIRGKPFEARSFLATLPVYFLVLMCCGAPLIWVAVGVAQNRALLADIGLSSFRLDLLFRTLAYNGAAAILATAMGLPVGWVLGRGRGIATRALWLIAPAALFMPSLAFAYAWSQVVRIADPIFQFLGVSFAPQSVSDVLRCVWTLSAWLWAVPACIIGLALRKMDTSVQQQALLDGGLLRVTLRQLLGPIIASLAAVTLLGSQEFAVYEPSGISVVATEVRMVFDTGAFSSINNPIAGSIPADGTFAIDQRTRAAAALATSLPLLLITCVLAGVCAWGATRIADVDSITLHDRPAILDAPRWAYLLAGTLLVINIVVPIVALLHSLREPLSIGKIVTTFAPALAGSYAVGGMAGCVALVIAISACVRRTPGLLIVSALSFMIGGQMLAIALIRLTNRPGLEWIYHSAVIPVAAYIGRFGWIALAAGLATWSKPWRELREMAAIDGAGRWRIATSIVWPLAWPTLLAASILIAALSLTEVPATVLISPQHPQVLTPLLMVWVHIARFDPIIQASLLMMAMVMVPVCVALLILRIARPFRRGWPETDHQKRKSRRPLQ